MSAGEDLVVQTEAVPEWTLADRLRKALEHADVSGPEMAEYLEVHRNTLSNWIYGHARPPASAVKLWAMRCGVPYKWLIGQEDAKRSTITRIRGDQLVLNEISAQAKYLDGDAVTELRRSLGHGVKQTNRRVRPADQQITSSAARS